MKRLVAALERLPSELRHMLRWRFRKQWTYSQIGQRTNRSEDAVRMLITRLLVNLREEVFSSDSSL